MKLTTVLFLSIFFPFKQRSQSNSCFCLRKLCNRNLPFGNVRQRTQSINVESARKNLIGFYECFRVFDLIISAIKFLCSFYNRHPSGKSVVSTISFEFLKFLDHQ